MNSNKNFSIRSSGIQTGKFYIDCAGFYAIDDIARLSGLEKSELERLYESSGAEYDSMSSIYYFPSKAAAAEVIGRLEESVAAKGFGKVVFLTFEEIEYIRQALIYEGSNIINVRNDLKKCIFDKFSR